MKVGLYFGSFNPIHIGHLIIASHVANHGDVQQVWMVVSPQNPLKPSSVLLNELNCFKEQESRKLLAQKIGVRQDHVAEYLFDEAGKKIESDTLLPRLIQQKENITAYITQKYLNGYLSRFESNIYAFPANDTNYVIDGRTLANFQQQADNGKPTFWRNLV